MDLLPSIRRNRFLWIFLATGLLVQVVAYWWMPDNPWSLVSGLLGICSVVLCSQGNILTFIFGFGQILTYTYLCWLERFYAGIAMNAFYFASQIYGLWYWRRLASSEGSSLNTELTTFHSLRWPWLVALTVALVGLSLLTGCLLSFYTDDTQPYLDAFTTVPAIAAQILMVLAFREHWFIWLTIDILYVVLWARAGNYCMLMQYAFWCINCVYGFTRWSRSLPARA